MGRGARPKRSSSILRFPGLGLGRRAVGAQAEMPAQLSQGSGPDAR